MGPFLTIPSSASLEVVEGSSEQLSKLLKTTARWGLCLAWIAG